MADQPQPPQAGSPGAPYGVPPGYAAPVYAPPGYPPPGYPPQASWGQPAGFGPPGFATPNSSVGGFGSTVPITGRTIPAPPGLVVGMEYGGFWIRYAAMGLDLLIIYALMFLIAITVIGLLVFWVVPFVYFPFFWTRGQTPGNRICGLRVVRASDGGPIDTGTAIVRVILMALEGLGVYVLIGLIGFIWAAFDDRKQAWHDKAAGTVVVHAQLYRAA